MNKSFREKINDAHLLLLNKLTLEYFGILSYSLEKDSMSKEELEKISGGIPIGGFTDGKRIVYLDAPSVSVGDIVLTTIHEVLHVISYHIQRLDTRIPEVWQMASDHVVNRICYALLASGTNSFKMPENIVYFPDIDREYPGISVEDLYELLVKKINIPKLIGQGASGSKGGNDPDKNRYEVRRIKTPHGDVIEVTDTKTGKKMRGFMDADLSSLPKKKSDEKKDGKDGESEVESVEANLEELREKARTTWHSNIVNKGVLDGNFIGYLDNILKIEAPWDHLLESAIRYPVQSASKRTWSQKDFYFRNVRVPGRKVRGLNMFTLVASLDTSGSVDDDSLRKFLGVLLGSASYFKKMILIMHDHVVQDTIDIIGLTNQDALIEKFNKIKGRGGTSHKGPFESIEKLTEDENVSTVVFMTDFESDVEHIYQEYKWVREYPMVWVLNRDHPVELEGCDYEVFRI